LKKKLETYGEVISTNEQYETELMRLKQRENDYRKSLEDLSKEIEDLQQDNLLLRKEGIKLDTKEGWLNRQMTTSPMIESRRSITPLSSPQLRHWIQVSIGDEEWQMELRRLHSTIEFLRNENKRLRLMKTHLDMETTLSMMKCSSNRHFKLDHFTRFLIQKVVSSLKIPRIVSLEGEPNPTLQKMRQIDLHLNSIYAMTISHLVRIPPCRDLELSERFIMK
jgi:hypothetical protein